MSIGYSHWEPWGCAQRQQDQATPSHLLQKTLQNLCVSSERQGLGAAPAAFQPSHQLGDGSAAQHFMRIDCWEGFSSSRVTCGLETPELGPKERWCGKTAMTLVWLSLPKLTDRKAEKRRCFRDITTVQSRSLRRLSVAHLSVHPGRQSSFTSVSPSCSATPLPR